MEATTILQIWGFSEFLMQDSHVLQVIETLQCDITEETFPLSCIN